MRINVRRLGHAPKEPEEFTEYERHNVISLVVGRFVTRWHEEGDATEYAERNDDLWWVKIEDDAGET